MIYLDNNATTKLDDEVLNTMLPYLRGTTGYAINPARDLGPRIVHSLLPIKNKASFNLNYAWVPVVGPMLGSALAVLIYLSIH